MHFPAICSTQNLKLFDPQTKLEVNLKGVEMTLKKEVTLKEVEFYLNFSWNNFETLIRTLYTNNFLVSLRQ